MALPSQVSKTIEITVGLFGLFYLSIFGKMYDFDVLGQMDLNLSAIFLESKFSFLNVSLVSLTNLLCCSGVCRIIVLCLR